MLYRTSIPTFLILFLALFFALFDNVSAARDVVLPAPRVRVTRLSNSGRPVGPAAQDPQRRYPEQVLQGSESSRRGERRDDRARNLRLLRPSDADNLRRTQRTSGRDSFYNEDGYAKKQSSRMNPPRELRKSRYPREDEDRYAKKPTSRKEPPQEPRKSRQSYEEEEEWWAKKPSRRRASPRGSDIVWTNARSNDGNEDGGKDGWDSDDMSTIGSKSSFDQNRGSRSARRPSGSRNIGGSYPDSESDLSSRESKDADSDTSDLNSDLEMALRRKSGTIKKTRSQQPGQRRGWVTQGEGEESESADDNYRSSTSRADRNPIIVRSRPGRPARITQNSRYQAIEISPSDFDESSSSSASESGSDSDDSWGGRKQASSKTSRSQRTKGSINSRTSDAKSRDRSRSRSRSKGGRW